MEEKDTNESTTTTYILDVDDVTMESTQFTELTAGMKQISDNVQTLNASVVHATMFLILLCIFQFYGLLRRASKKGGV